MTLLSLCVFAIALGCSFVLTRCVRNLANARGWAKPPDCDHHLHEQPLPRLGGVAIFAAFISGLLFMQLVVRHKSELVVADGGQTLLTLIAAGTVVFLLGVVDDIRHIGPSTKFAVQSVAAFILYAGGLRVLRLPVLFGDHALPWFIDLPCTIIWVLAITNAFNLIDGVDGLAAGSALFSTMAVFIVSLVNHADLVSLLTLALSGAILGFLRYNFNPATIFLGDSGSLFIGFMLSALALQGVQKAPTILAVAIPVVSFGLPILETSLSVLRRWIARKPLFSADQDHIHHKLLARGLSQRQVVIILYAVSAMFALLSLFLLAPGGGTTGIVFVVIGSGVWLGVQQLGYLEFGELRRMAQRAVEQRKVFANNLAIRHAIEQLKAVRDYDHLSQILVAAFQQNDFDGFDLKINDLAELMPAVDVRDIDLESVGKRDLYWRKTGSDMTDNTWAGWRLNLDVVGGRQTLATMTIYHAQRDQFLQLDLNLLTNQLPQALALALMASSSRSVVISSDYSIEGANLAQAS